MTTLTTIRLGYRTLAYFNANPNLVLKAGEHLYLSDTVNRGQFKMGDGVTVLSALTWYGGSGDSFKAMITGADTTPDYLNSKIAVGGIISKAVQNPGGNENILLSAAESDPVFGAWLAGPPNVSLFTNDAGYITSDSDAIHKSVSNEIHGLTNKATPVDADEIIGENSAGGAWSKIRISLSNLYAYINGKLSSVYQAILISGTNIKTINGNSLLGAGNVVVSGSPYSDYKVHFSSQTDLVKVSTAVSGTDLIVTVTGTWFLMWGDHFVQFTGASYTVPAWGIIYVDLDLAAGTAGPVTAAVYTTTRQDQSGTIRLILAIRNNDSLGFNVWNYQDGRSLDQTTKNIIDNSVLSEYKNYTIKTVKKDGSGDYLTIQAALTAISTLATSLNRYEIQVYDDFYYTDVTPYGVGISIFTTASYVKITGMNGMRTIYSEIPLTGGYDRSQYSIMTVGNNVVHFEIENIQLILKNGRYPVHADPTGTNIMSAKNCIFQHLGNLPLGDGAQWTFPDAWGAGIRDNQFWYFENVKFIGIRAGFAIHNGSVSYPAKVIFKNCEFVNDKNNADISTNPTGAVLLRTLDSLQKDIFEFYNCKVNGKFQIEGAINNANYSDTYIPKIIGSSCPIYYAIDTTAHAGGHVLKIVSATTGAASSVRVDSETAGIYGGQIFKDGGGGLAGWNYGQYDIIGSSLGTRLGDCSSVNKTIDLVVDGTPVTFTFNEDYTGQTNAYVIGKMNTGLTGIAVVSEFDLAAEYYPEFDIIQAYNLSTTTEILKGTLVKRIGIYVRPATSGENADGILLDDLVPSDLANRQDDSSRVLLKGYLPITGRFAPTISSVPVLADKLIIGATPGQLEVSTSGQFVCEAVTIEGTVVLKFNTDELNPVYSAGGDPTDYIIAIG